MTPEERALKRSRENILPNTSFSKAWDLDWLGVLKGLCGKGATCTNTATGFYYPDRTTAGSRNLLENPEQAGFKIVDLKDAVPGSIIVISNPDGSERHSTIFDSVYKGKPYWYYDPHDKNQYYIQEGDTLVNYSNGKHEFGNYRKGVPLNKAFVNRTKHTYLMARKFGGKIRKWLSGSVVIPPMYSETDVNKTLDYTSSDLSKAAIKKISDTYEDYLNKNILGFKLPIVGDLIDVAIKEIPGPMQILEGVGSIANMYEKGIDAENLRDLISGGAAFIPGINTYFEGLNLLIDLTLSLNSSSNSAKARKLILKNLNDALNKPNARLINVDKSTGDWQVAYPKRNIDGEFVYTLVKGRGLPKNPTDQLVNEYLTYQGKLRRGEN